MLARLMVLITLFFAGIASLGATENVEYVWVWQPATCHSAGYWYRKAVAVKVVLRQTYSVSYDAEKSAIVDAIDRLTKAVERIESGKGAATYGDGKALMLAKCAACHDAKTSATKANGFVLMDGDTIPPFSVVEKRAILERVKSTDNAKVMPPQKPLSAAEIKLVEALLSGEAVKK